MRSCKNSNRDLVVNTEPRQHSSQQLAGWHGGEPGISNSSRRQDATAAATLTPSADTAASPRRQASLPIAGSPGSPECVGESTWAERDAALRLQAVELSPSSSSRTADASPPRSQSIPKQGSDSCRDPSTPSPADGEQVDVQRELQGYYQRCIVQSDAAWQQERDRRRKRRKQKQERWLIERRREQDDWSSDAPLESSEDEHEQQQEQEQQQQQQQQQQQEQEQQQQIELQQIELQEQQWEAAVTQHEHQQIEQRQRQELTSQVTRYDHAGRPARARRSARRLEERAAHANGDAEAQPTWLAEASMLMDALRVAV